MARQVRQALFKRDKYTVPAGSLYLDMMEREEVDSHTQVGVEVLAEGDMLHSLGD